MADPLVDAHRLLPGLFTLAVPLVPISIRDQMVRGTELAARIGKPAGSAKALVIGAGVGGVCAAVELAKRGFDVQIADAAATAFSVQANAETRFLDPWQYDWPTPTRARRPVFGRRFALSYFPASGPDLHRWWNRELMRWQGVLKPGRRGPSGPVAGSLTVLPPTTITSLSVTTSGPGGQLQALPLTTPFDVVILAVGFGAEKSSLPLNPPPGDLHTPAFWEEDEFEEDDFGLGSGGPWKVGVVGSGDGALQDFLRAATSSPAAPAGSSRRGGRRATAQHIFDTLFPPGVVYPPTGAVPRDELLIEAAAIDARFQRAWAWTERGHPAEKAIFQERHTALEGLVQRHAASVAASDLATLQRSDLDQATLVYSEDAFVALYTLNCFCVLLLSHLLPGQVRLCPMSSVTDARDGMHPQTGPAKGYVAGGAYELDPGTPNAMSFDVLIVRRGITPPVPLHPAWAQLSRPRHLLPLD